tara:strand:+ start:2805 stop:3560 length:756 start_codon:yes stop_codon:yes gene_type:complete
MNQTKAGIKDLRMVVWSHSTYSDLWKMFFGQLEENASFFKKTLLVEKKVDFDFKDCDVIINDEKLPWCQRLINCLEKIDEKYIVWMLEDFIIYNAVDINDIARLKNFLENTEYSYVKLLRAGIDGGKEVIKNVYEVPMNNKYLYSLNATIWKKEALIKLFKNYRPEKLFGAFEIEASKICREIDIYGCYHYANEPKRARLHYDSSIFPHIMSAIKGGCVGKRPSWNMTQYSHELNALLKKYNIDRNIRGVC